MRKFILTSLITGLLLSASVAGASAHTLTVNPHGQDDPTVNQEVSRGWAQAHCQAAAPEKASANSEVIAFGPDEALTGCEPGEDAPGQDK